MLGSRETVILLGLAAGAGCVARPEALSPGPWIGLSTDAVVLRHSVGVGHAAAGTVTIRNAGGDSFGVPQLGVQYVEQVGDWLAPELAGDGQTYQLSLHPRNPDGGPLPVGTYHAKVEISADKAENSPVFVDVVAEVVQPQIVSRPPSLAIVGALGGKAWLPRPRIEEALAGDLPEPIFLLAIPGGQDWLRLGTPSLGWSEPDGATFWDPGLALDTAALERGDYSATVTAIAVGVGSVDVPVSLAVRDWGETPGDDSPGWSPECPPPIALPDGRVLCTGTTPWTFDPATGAWGALPARSAFPVRMTALLGDGKVLFLHHGSACTSPFRCSPRTEWAVLDPATGLWTSAGELRDPYGGTATALADGRVLLTGHLPAVGDEYGPWRSSVTLDPADGTAVQTASMAFPHQHGAAVRLADGRVLVAGGVSRDGWQSHAEIFAAGVGSGSWTTTGSMSAPRADFSLTLLPDGRVLAAGGQNETGVLATAEVFDPGTGRWTAVGSMNARRQLYGNLLPLPDGRLLVTGGLGADFAPLRLAESYDPASGTWTPWSELPGWRFLHATVLLDGSWVLVIGGQSENPAAGEVRQLAYP